MAVSFLLEYWAAPVLKRWVACLLVTIALGALSLNAQAVTLTVDDDGAGDYTIIQEAIDGASAGDIILVNGGEDRIHNEFALRVDKNVTIHGLGVTTTELRISSRITIEEGITSSFENLSIVIGDLARAFVAIYISPTGHLEINNCFVITTGLKSAVSTFNSELIVRSSKIISTRTAIVNGGSPRGGSVSTIEKSYIEGGGVGVHNHRGTVTIKDSTIGNSGTGIQAGIGTLGRSSTLVQNTTISGSFSAGIRNNNDLSLINTIVANTESGVDCINNPGIPGFSTAPLIVEQSNNLLEGAGENACDIGNGEAGTITNQDPKLRPLQDNGGETLTFALGHDSPAIDAGSNASCTPLDQRGVARPIDGDLDGTAICDIGAYEAPPNRPPTISSPSSVAVPENSTLAQTITVNDPDGDAITYQITAGADRAKFTINTTGQLSFLTAPNFEAPSDANSDNIYEVEVTVDDGNGETDSLLIQVTVTNVNEPPSIAPTATVLIIENTVRVGTITATDPDAGDSLRFSLGSGLDAPLFRITAEGVLRFAVFPDFENPHDTGADNLYQVEVIVKDAANSADSRVVLVQVTDVPEPLTISGRPSIDVVFNNPYSFTPMAFDSDGTEINFDVENRPPWATFDTATGTLSGTPALSESGIYDSIVISATSGGDTVSLPIFRIVVAGINQPPRFNVIGANPIRVCTNAGGQNIPFINEISDGDFETQQLEFIVENTNPSLFGGLLGFGGQPYISEVSGDLFFRGGLNRAGGADVTVMLQDDGGTASGGRDTSSTYHFSIIIDPTCDDGAGELFNPGQFDLDQITGSHEDETEFADLTIGLNEGRFNTVLETIGDVGNIPLDAVTGIGNVDEPTTAEITLFTATISNQSKHAGQQVSLRITLDADQKFLKYDPRCEIDTSNGQAACYLQSVPAGITKLGFEAQSFDGKAVNAIAEIHAANDQEFRDNRAQLRSVVKSADGETDDSAASNGGGSMNWLGLLLLYGLRRKMH